MLNLRPLKSKATTMISFLLCILALIAGYIFYGAFVEKVFGPDKSRKTPAYEKSDGVDYIAMPTWKVFMIQFLNIAGTGPIFGAIMGAKFGPASYLWIVFGCIFAGAVHDFLTGMLSLRNGGISLPQIIGKYLGNGTRNVMLAFTILLLLLVGAVFVYSPAVILKDMAGDGSLKAALIWSAAIFIYYLLATMLPVDKVIGRLYPLFGFALLFMSVSLLTGLIVKWPSLPEFWDGLSNRTPTVPGGAQAMFPCLFITIACGAISGFHATQSPMMARCMKNEKYGRPVFYGSMITEGLVALIWAAISSYFFFDGGAQEVGLDLGATAPQVVTAVSTKWLGLLGGILAVLGVVAAPITSGDTALRSCRMIVADSLKIDQKPMRKRLAISVPIFVVSGVLLWFQIANENGFNVIWRYFGWANQTLAVFSLWAVTAFLVKERKGLTYLITLVPACFMTAVTATYILIQKIGFNLPTEWNRGLGVAIFLGSALVFYLLKRRSGK